MVPGAHAGPGVVLVPVELTSKEEGSGRDARDRTGCDAVRPRAPRAAVADAAVLSVRRERPRRPWWANVSNPGSDAVCELKDR